jgi:hypothetical protein
MIWEMSSVSEAGMAGDGNVQEYDATYIFCELLVYFFISGCCIQYRNSFILGK